MKFYCVTACTIILLAAVHLSCECGCGCGCASGCDVQQTLAAIYPCNLAQALFGAAQIRHFGLGAKAVATQLLQVAAAPCVSICELKTSLSAVGMIWKGTAKGIPELIKLLCPALQPAAVNFQQALEMQGEAALKASCDCCFTLYDLKVTAAEAAKTVCCAACPVLSNSCICGSCSGCTSCNSCGNDDCNTCGNDGCNCCGNNGCSNCGNDGCNSCANDGCNSCGNYVCNSCNKCGNDDCSSCGNDGCNSCGNDGCNSCGICVCNSCNKCGNDDCSSCGNCACNSCATSGNYGDGNITE